MPVEMKQDEIIAMVNEHAQRMGDSFRIKVWRWANGAANSEQVCTFAETTVYQIMNPELWLSVFSGGGQYLALIFHMQNATQPIGGYYKISLAGNPHALDLRSIDRPDWQGPRNMEFPTQQQREQILTSGAASPTNPNSTSGANSGVGGQGGGATDPRVADLIRDLNIQRDNLSASQRQLDETRHQLELSRIKMESDGRMRELEMKITAATQQMQQPKEPAWSGLKELLAPLLGLFQAWMTGQSEMRQLMFKIDSERSAKSDALMMKMMERPAVDPLMMTLFEKLQGFSQSHNPSAEMIGQMAELTMSMVDRAAEMANGPSESHWITAAREFAKAIGAAVGGMKIQQKKPGAGAPAQGFPTGPGLPPPSGIPQNPAGAPGSRAQPFPNGFAGMPTPQNGAGAVPTQTYQQPAPGVTQPPPQPAPAPEQPQVMSVIDSLIFAVKQYAPVEQIAKAVIASVPDPGFQQELAAVDGSLQGLAAKYLGDWVPQDAQRNGPYLTSLLAAIEKEGRTAGVFEDDRPQQQQQEPEGEPEADAETSD
jgi:hypothetical protein